MEHIVLKIEYLDHEKILLTNSRGDTYSSKSEELKDFLHNKPIKESEQDELFDDVVHEVGKFFADETNEVSREEFVKELSKQYHLIKK